MSASDKEGMISKVISLLFFALLLSPLAMAEDYTVVKGDTGTGIAAKKKTALELLQRANPDLDWQKLKPGDKVFVPDRYTVKAGDTLYSLCRAWGVDQSAVLALNALAGAALKTGQILFLPPVPKTKAATSVVTAPAAGNPFWPVDKTPRAEGDKLKSVSFATAGEPFRSVSNGIVVYLGEFRGVGRVLFVQAADKSVFAYGNFENASVEFGQTVSRGQTLGVTSPRSSQKLSFFAFRQTDSLDVFTVKR